ncbi:MAG: hypothetical protein EAY81_08595 [Bacteroidetes bacterium]|nr:MAG: hypothetical protein EAY81_08595 [Bacteroidota bacterium]
MSFGLFTKWWYVLPLDGRQTYLWGFPFAWVGEGWQTSGALQFFVLEGIVDFIVYYLCWFIAIYGLTRYIKLTINKPTLYILRLSAVIIMASYAVGISISYPTFNTHRHFDMQIIRSGYGVVWSYQTDYEQLLPQQNNTIPNNPQ